MVTATREATNDGNSGDGRGGGGGVVGCGICVVRNNFYFEKNNRNVASIYPYVLDFSKQTVPEKKEQVNVWCCSSCVRAKR